jgi:hypothetical protein
MMMLFIAVVSAGFCLEKFLRRARRIREFTTLYQKFPDWPPGARTANGTALCH